MHKCKCKDLALERAENAPCPYLGVSDHRKSNDRTETQTGNAEILEVHAFYCERDTPDMINQPQCCMNNKNYCWHKLLIRCEIVLSRQTFISLFLFRAYFGQELAIRTGRDLLTCKVTIHSLLCIEIVRKSLTDVSLRMLRYRQPDTNQILLTLANKGGGGGNADNQTFRQQCAGNLSKIICLKQDFLRCSKQVEKNRMLRVIKKKLEYIIQTQQKNHI